MITEIAQIDVKPGMEQEFEAGVAKAAPVFKRAKGCTAWSCSGRSRNRPLPAVRAMGNGGKPHRRFPRQRGFPGMARWSGIALRARPRSSIRAQVFKGF